jgi:hypothetical protein
VTQIGENAFLGCSSLKSILIPRKLKENLPEHLENDKRKAFY